MPIGSEIPDEESDEDEDLQVPDQEMDSKNSPKEIKNIVTKAGEEELTDALDLSCFFGSLRQDDRDTWRDCWTIPDAKSFRVHRKRFIFDGCKVPAGQLLMQLIKIVVVINKVNMPLLPLESMLASASNAGIGLISREGEQKMEISVDRALIQSLNLKLGEVCHVLTTAVTVLLITVKEVHIDLA